MYGAKLRTDGLPIPIKRELSALHKNKIAGEELWKQAATIYTLQDLKNRAPLETSTEDEWPQIACSLARV